MTRTPDDLTIVPRDLRFGRDPRRERWWLNGDPIATAFYNALSVTFPKGEAFFVESVRAFREGTPEKLRREIDAFVKQEVIHSREHVAFNRHVVDQGYDVSRLEADVVRSLEITKGRPPIANLAATMALEHFTAILAHELISHGPHLDGGEAQAVALWRWHAAEEIEHKGVAYDAWLHATRHWPRWKRWRIKSIVMLKVTETFVRHRARGMLDLLAQDGLTGRRTKAKLAWYALFRPGMALRVAVMWFTYFLPGFHPWMHDDRELIALAESDYEAAVLPQHQKARRVA